MTVTVEIFGEIYLSWRQKNLRIFWGHHCLLSGQFWGSFEARNLSFKVSDQVQHNPA